MGLTPAKGGDTISPRTKLALVAIAATMAMIVAMVGLASLGPKTKPASVNEPPVSVFTYSANNLTVVFNASASHDPDGSIANYTWTFGDETGFHGKDVTHMYLANGTYRAKLTVTDNGGAKNSTSMEVTVARTVTPVTNKQPVAVIEIVSIDDLTVELSGVDSMAAPGATIVSYAWDFGDGTNGTGANVTHTYAQNGTYRITLTVTESFDLSDNASVRVTVSSTPLPPPEPHPQGPPGLLHAIEIHKEKADRNHGLQNSLDHLEGNLSKWLQTNGPST